MRLPCWPTTALSAWSASGAEKGRPAERYHADKLEESESESYLALALFSLHKAYLEDGQMPLYTKETK